MTYARLDQAGLQWPCPNEDHPGTALLHAQQFGHAPHATLQCVEYRPTSEHTTAQYPFMLITGRSLYQFNAGTMTGRSLNNELRPADVLDISPDDAASVQVRDGDGVRVVSQYGVAVLPVRISPQVARGQLFATFQTKEFLVNALTGSNRDRVTDTPEYKVTAVRVERVAAGKTSPI
jgi:formate dehydrogenase major subunit